MRRAAAHPSNAHELTAALQGSSRPSALCHSLRTCRCRVQSVSYTVGVVNCPTICRVYVWRPILPGAVIVQSRQSIDPAFASATPIPLLTTAATAPQAFLARPETLRDSDASSVHYAGT